MPGGSFQVVWTSLTGAEVCAACERRIETGQRALRYQGGARGTDRLMGSWFHGFECLARGAEARAYEEEDRGSSRGEAYRDLQRWAVDQDRARRAAGRL